MSTCWCCNEEVSPLFIKGYGTKNEFKVCGSCIGVLAVIDSRLKQITLTGNLSETFTAKRKSIRKRK